MSALAGQTQRARRISAKRGRRADRSRRADAGTVTEMARALLRDAREAGGEREWDRHVAGLGQVGRAHRNERVAQAA